MASALIMTSLIMVFSVSIGFANLKVPNITYSNYADTNIKFVRDRLDVFSSFFPLIIGLIYIGLILLLDYQYFIFYSTSPWLPELFIPAVWLSESYILNIGFYLSDLIYMWMSAKYLTNMQEVVCKIFNWCGRNPLHLCGGSSLLLLIPKLTLLCSATICAIILCKPYKL